MIDRIWAPVDWLLARASAFFELLWINGEIGLLYLLVIFYLAIIIIWILVVPRLKLYIAQSTDVKLFRLSYGRKLSRFLARVLAHPIGITSILLAFQLSMPLWGESLLLKCRGDSYGLIICRFEGPEFLEEFGKFGISEKLSHELLALADPELGIQLRISDKSFQESEQASKWKNKQHAKMLIWGYTEATQDTIAIHLFYEGVPEFAFVHPDSPLDTVHFGFWYQHQRLAIPRGSLQTQQLFSIRVDSYLRARLAALAFQLGNCKSALANFRALGYMEDSSHTEERLLTSFVEVECLRREEQWSSLINAALRSDSLMKLNAGFPVIFRAEAQYNAGLAYVQLGDTQSASTHFTNALTLSSRDANACRELAKIYLSRWEIDSVIATTARCEEVAQASAPILTFRCIAILLKYGPVEEAKTLYSKVRRLDPIFASDIDSVARRLQVSLRD